MMTKKNSYTALLTALVYTLFAVASLAQGVDELRLKQMLGFLASDEMEGRKPGTPGDIATANYILEQFKKAGLNVDPPFGLQSFDVVIDAAPGDKNHLVLNDRALVYGQDFVTLSFSGSGSEVKGGLVFAGYGFEVKNDTLDWNDWAQLDVKDNWVLLLRGSHEQDNPNSAFAPFTSERDKVLLAKDKGAAGVLFVNGPAFQEKDGLMDMYFDKSPADAGIPVFHITRESAAYLLSDEGYDLKTLESGIREKKQPGSFQLTDRISGSTEVILIRTPTYNVSGWLQGSTASSVLSHTIVGAHYDHLGWGGPGSGSRKPDTVAVHNGADDNASGVAGVIELAYLMAGQQRPERSVLFMAFGAEEMGLLGSRYYVDHPVVALDHVQAMINFDMIGRLRDDRSLLIGGTGTAKESEGILAGVKEKHHFELSLSPEGFGASDHASFYARNIPVYFISTGAHEDYHTPEDDLEHIDIQGMADVVRFSADLLTVVTKKDQELSFQESGPKSRPRHGRGYKVTLGIMPDFAGTSTGGLRVDAVRPEGPAGMGGMKKGDFITAIDGKQVGSIYDYMARLKALEQGQSITVDVLREGKKQVLIIQL